MKNTLFILIILIHSITLLVADNIKNNQYDLKQLCSGKDGSLACFITGDEYERGLNKERNIAKAMKFYFHSCENNESMACNAIGNIYKDEIHDNFKASEYYEKACQMKNGYGCSNLGIMYLTGKGVKYNIQKAKDLFGLGCDLKSETGCNGYKQLNLSE